METFKKYISLTKPGVLFGNVLSGAAGFFLASGTNIPWSLFFWLITGMTLIIASACVLNNYFDRDIDSVMARTKKRAMASGEISGRNGIILTIILGILGLGALLHTNAYTVAIGALGFVTYVWLYGKYSKRMSVHGTVIGSISGAMPILAGYCAVADRIDLGAILLFLILFFWQFPEFYSIAIYRREEYKKANVPVISVVKGVTHTKRQILFYTTAFVISTLLLSLFGYTGFVYTVAMALLGTYWMYLGIKLLRCKDDNFWGKKMFRFSLVTLLVFCFLLIIHSLLP